MLLEDKTKEQKQWRW